MKIKMTKLANLYLSSNNIFVELQGKDIQNIDERDKERFIETLTRIAEDANYIIKELKDGCKTNE